MTALLLSPHHLPDDETLFAAFTIIRERPKVIVVLESHLQEQRGNSYRPVDGETIRSPITNEVRREETRRAMQELLWGADRFEGVEDHLEFWPFRDDVPDWDAISVRIWDAVRDADRVFAPRPYEQGGHEHHEQIGKLARAWTPDDGRLALYDTYQYGRRRITDGTEVVPEPDWVARKLRALACYRSQIELWPHHFLAEQREYLA